MKLTRIFSSVERMISSDPSDPALEDQTELKIQGYQALRHLSDDLHFRQMRSPAQPLENSDRHIMHFLVLNPCFISKSGSASFEAHFSAVVAISSSSMEQDFRIVIPPPRDLGSGIHETIRRWRYSLRTTFRFLQFQARMKLFVPH